MVKFLQQDPPPAKLHNLLPNSTTNWSTTNWGPSVQIQEPMRNRFHANHPQILYKLQFKNWLLGNFCWLKFYKVIITKTSHVLNQIIHPPKHAYLLISTSLLLWYCDNYVINLEVPDFLLTFPTLLCICLNLHGISLYTNISNCGALKDTLNHPCFVAL